MLKLPEERRKWDESKGAGEGAGREKRKAGLDSGLDWTGLFFYEVFFLLGGGCIIFSSLLKNRVFNLSPTGYIFLIWRGEREGLYFSFSLCFSLRLVDSRSSSFP